MESMNCSLLNSIFNELKGFEVSLDPKNERRHLLFKYFQGLMDAGFNVCSVLSSYFSTEIHLLKMNGSEASENVLKLALLLSDFFIDGHWFEHSKRVLESCVSLIEDEEKISPIFFTFYVKLLHVYNALRDFKNSEQLVGKLRSIIDTQSLTQNQAYDASAACLRISEYSYFRFAINKDARIWCNEAFNLLTNTTPVLTRIDVFRHSMKLSLLWMEKERAKNFIEMAIKEAKQEFKINKKQILPISRAALHPKVVELFVDYGYYLFKDNQIDQSLEFYQKSLKIAEQIFEDVVAKQRVNNLLLANIYIEMADISFNESFANEQLENGLKIVAKIFPENHLELALAKQAKAEIVFRFAKENPDKKVKIQMLKNCESLLLYSLNVLRSEYSGCMNIDLANCYSLLGSIYHKLLHYDKAEQMLSEALNVCLELNGWNSDSFAIHSSNLGDVYKDMMRLEEAEHMYLRSIPIFIQLYGETYEELEYVYRKLIFIYRQLNNKEKVNEFELRLKKREDLLKNV
ncbi:Amyloid protein-binding protein 2-like protein [Dinothrombium tinctorium]|uniref:Amyloid protein-binding protein 2-like protein n=1 Tax=Dinothrombium tinctorium TaxID=1965070 RepID=A0A443RBS4_9ACAR|nr:Amyloid protein-binding protein 2-like protein [Dinothrombium tinctorium]